MITERLQGDYVLLRSDSLRLLISRLSLSSIAHLQDHSSFSGHCITEPQHLLQRPADEDRIQSMTEAHTFVALSDDLTLLQSVPQNRFVMTLHPQTAGIQWCWNEVQLFNNLDTTCAYLPSMIQTAITPMHAMLTLADGNQAFVCEFDKLLHYLMHR